MSRYEDGLKAGRAAEELRLPTASNFGMIDHVLLNIVLPGIGLGLSALAESDKATDKDDAEYIRGYKDGISIERDRLDAERQREIVQSMRNK